MGILTSKTLSQEGKPNKGFKVGGGVLWVADITGIAEAMMIRKLRNLQVMVVLLALYICTYIFSPLWRTALKRVVTGWGC